MIDATEYIIYRDDPVDWPPVEPTKEMCDRTKRLDAFWKTEIGKAFFAYKTAIILAQNTAGETHDMALREAQEAQDRLMRISELVY